MLCPEVSPEAPNRDKSLSKPSEDFISDAQRSKTVSSLVDTSVARRPTVPRMSPAVAPYPAAVPTGVPVAAPAATVMTIYDDEDANECVICMNGDAIDIRRTSCGHSVCRPCMARYVETQRKAERDVTCPICRTVLKEGVDLPPRPPPPPPEPNCETFPTPGPSFFAISCCCCCVVLGQLSAISASRYSASRTCVAVTVAIWLLVLLALVPDSLGALLDLTDTSISDSGETLDWSVNHLNEMLNGKSFEPSSGQDVNIDTDSFRIGATLRVSTWFLVILLWVVSGHLVGEARKVISQRYEIYQISMPDDCPACCTRPASASLSRRPSRSLIFF